MTTPEGVLCERRKPEVKKRFFQTMLTLMTLLLWISPGLGEDKPPDCTARDPRFCSSPCAYLRDRCRGDAECSLDLCSYLHPPDPPRRQRCRRLLFECGPDHRTTGKRGILNRDMAYLLLKLHPFVNQTSQFGFLTSGRFRRISGNLGTEFLGKRGDGRPVGGGDRSGGGAAGKPPAPPRFHGLPPNRFSRAKILKREEDFPGTRKRVASQGNGRVVLGSEFLGKRADGRTRRLGGSELLGKRDEPPFDGSEFLGKRTGTEYLEGNEFLGKRDREDLLEGTELLGKRRPPSALDYLSERFGDELPGKKWDAEAAIPEPGDDGGRLARRSPVAQGSSDDDDDRDDVSD